MLKWLAHIYQSKQLYSKMNRIFNFLSCFLITSIAFSQYAEARVSPRQVAAKESPPVTDFCAQEKQKIASLPHLKLVLWLEDGEYNAELSDADARTIRELLLAHTRYKAPLKQGREDFWKNIDDGYEPPMTILVFEGDDKTQFLDLSVGFELISQSKNKQLEENGYCFTGVEILLEDSAYQKLLQVLKPYVPAMWKADFERMTK